MKPEVRSRIWNYRDQGWSLDRIARRLNEDGVLTSQGGKNLKGGRSGTPRP
jgi:hypothetical protein